MSALQPYAIPKDGFISTGSGANYQAVTGSDHHQVATAGFPPGTKISYFNSALNGYGTCTYLKYEQGAGAVALIAGHVCVWDPTEADYYAVTADRTDATVGPCAISLGIWAVGTDGYYGFFWTGGVCPDLTTLVGSTETRLSAVDAITDGGVAAGDWLYPHATTDGGLDTYVWSTTATVPAGRTLAADTSTTLALSNIVLTDLWG